MVRWISPIYREFQHDDRPPTISTRSSTSAPVKPRFFSSTKESDRRSANRFQVILDGPPKDDWPLMEEDPKTIAVPGF